MIYRESGDFKTSYHGDQQMFPIALDKWFVILVCSFAFLVVPFIINDYWEKSVLVPVLVWAMAALGLNILTGYCGQVSLGTGGFMAVGAYASYKLMTSFPELNLFVVILLAGGVTALVGVVFGLPSLSNQGVLPGSRHPGCPVFSCLAVQQGALVLQLCGNRHDYGTGEICVWGRGFGTECPSLGDVPVLSYHCGDFCGHRKKPDPRKIRTGMDGHPGHGHCR